MEGLKEYILREDAVAAVMETDPHVFLTYNKKKEKTDIVVAQITEEVLEEINKIPAADVQEVRPGRWVDGKRIGFDGTYHWFRQCSECLYEREDDNSEKDTNYCPNCGALLKGE